MGLRTVARFTEPWEAHMFRLLLQAEGLFAVVAFDQHASADYSMAWAIGGVRVQVTDVDWEQALEIESRCRAGDFRIALDAEAGPPELSICPRCGSEQYESRRCTSYVVSLLTALVFGVVLPMWAHINTCSRCTKRWAE